MHSGRTLKFTEAEYSISYSHLTLPQEFTQLQITLKSCSTAHDKYGE